MSRVGKRILTIPQGASVEVDRERNRVVVRGPLGELEREFSKDFAIQVKDNSLSVKPKIDKKGIKILYGTTNALIFNMLKGVTESFKKTLIFEGVGYRAGFKDNQLEVLVGYSHPIFLDIPQGLEVKVIKPTEVEVRGIDKVLVGHFSAKIRALRPPSPYSGKGIHYSDEKVKRKEVKKGTK